MASAAVDKGIIDSYYELFETPGRLDQSAELALRYQVMDFALDLFEKQEQNTPPTVVHAYFATLTREPRLEEHAAGIKAAFLANKHFANCCVQQLHAIMGLGVEVTEDGLSLNPGVNIILKNAFLGYVQPTTAQQQTRSDANGHGGYVYYATNPIIPTQEQLLLAIKGALQVCESRAVSVWTRGVQPFLTDT